MRKTKIICTIGPACDNEKTLKQMIEAGMDVARLNFSHGTHEEHQAKFDLLNKIRNELNKPLGILLDTKGPEYRCGNFANKKELLTTGDTFIFTTDDIIGSKEKVSVSYKNLANELKPGDTVLVNNGILIFEVKEVQGNDIITRVICGGEISDHKSMSFPNKVLKQTFLSEQDKKDLLWGIKNHVDFVAASFVSTKQDMLDMKKFLDDNGGSSICLIAKIENQSGVDNIEGICEVCDGIMVARGDLGVEIPFEKLPAIQKVLIDKCRLLGKRVITATEMLESMIHNPRPTRAEISDVANAIYDGTSAIMLSGESAAGDHPVLAVKTMAKIACSTEENLDYYSRFHNAHFKINDEIDEISHSVCNMAMDVEAKAIIVCSYSGKTARMVSRFRPKEDIVAYCVNKDAWYQLSMSWGVTPLLSKVYDNVVDLFDHAEQDSFKHLGLSKGDKVILTGGISCKSGSTDLIFVDKIK